MALHENHPNTAILLDRLMDYLGKHKADTVLIVFIVLMLIPNIVNLMTAVI